MIELPEWTDWDNPPATNALRSVLKKWEGTPYMEGQCCKGVGVDCVRFVVAVLDELFQKDTLKIPRMPPDTSIHNPEGVRKIIYFILSQYKKENIKDGKIQPGDVVVVDVGPNEGHVMIVGPDRGTIWHSDRDVGVGYSGIGAIKSLYRIWRSPERDLWGQSLAHPK